MSALDDLAARIDALENGLTLDQLPVAALRRALIDNGEPLDLSVASLEPLPAPLVTTLPSGPKDGMEINFLADATNGVVWRLKYRAGATSFKWEFIGGSALMSAAGGSVFPITGNGSDAGVAFTLPLAGDYDAEIQAHADGDPTTDFQLNVGLGVAALEGDAINWRSQSGNFGWIPGMVRSRYLGKAKNDVLKTFWTTGGTPGTGYRLFGRRAFLWPVRVG